MNIGIIGARRTSNGIGEFIAKYFHAAGAQVNAVLGTTERSSRVAADNLKKYGIMAHPYIDFSRMMNEEDLDAQQSTLFVRKGKFSKDRYVPLSASTVEALLRYRQRVASASTEQALLVSRQGKRLHATTIGNLFANCCANAQSPQQRRGPVCMS